MDEKKSGGMIFPTEFTIKIFGTKDDTFEAAVLKIILQHAKILRENAIRARVSRENKYMALSVTIYVDSREQLDAIYQDLTKSPHVLMAL
jgi:uncharacterized protein